MGIFLCQTQKIPASMKNSDSKMASKTVMHVDEINAAVLLTPEMAQRNFSVHIHLQGQLGNYSTCRANR